MKRQYFGTDGVRGEFGGPVINESFAARLGEAAGRWLRRDGAAGSSSAQPLVLIGRDTRGSGPLLERALARGLAAAGVRVGSLGVVPTPAVSLAVREHKAALGVVVTASHNPAGDNGIKFFGPTGIKLDDADELLIESLLPSAPTSVEAASTEVAAEASYVRRLSERLRPGVLRGWRVVVDAGNGAAYRTTPAVLRALGAEVELLGGSPDGTNINAGCGSQHPQAMCHRVVETGARLGIAHDGDADRLIVSDELGAEVDGDEILAILAGEALRQGRLQHHTLVATVQSNLGLKRFMEQQRGRLIQTAVGDRYVVAAMLEGGFNLGGENSGHIICTDVSPCGDGLAAALLIIEAMIATGRPLSQLRSCLKKFPQATRALRVTRKPEVATLAILTAAIAAAESRLGADGRVLVRYSGTEPKIRLLVEGPEEALVAELMASLERAVEQEGLRA
jgi:phosphoglucosamine mutase